ncbi:MAG: hypothetical protein ACYS6K_05295 [Planctomycetota bacterium]
MNRKEVVHGYSGTAVESRVTDESNLCSVGTAIDRFIKKAGDAYG